MTEHRLHHILLALLLAITALMSFTSTVWAQGLSGTGTSDDPYLINDSIEWNWFAQSITNDSTYAGKFVQLTDDIIVSTMAGIENKCFSGTFDGQGYTITLDMTATMQFTALFCYADGATFQNLKVDGVLNTSKKFCAGLVGAVVYHGCTFTNCVSDVTINSSVQGDGSHGGFVSFLWRANTFEGCAFTGKLLGPSTTNVGGFVGFTETNQQGSVTFTNCLFIPEEVTMSSNGSQTFARWRSGDSAVTTGANCYYSQTLGAAQGKMMHSITGGANVTVSANGQATTYSMSGIQAYNAGIVYDGTLYAGEGDTVSLNLSCEVPWGYVFEGSYLAEPAATLGGTANPYTLTMSNADVTIIPIYTGYTVSVEATPNIYGAVQVSLDNTTWDSSVSAPIGDTVYFRINPPNGYSFDPLTLHIHTEEGNPVSYTGNQFTMPASNVTVYAEFFNTGSGTSVFFTVTLSPGDGGGNPIVYTFDPATAALNPDSADTCQFYYVNYNTIGFRLPNDYCPDSFTAPEGYNFDGWFGGNNDGYITLTSASTTFTARWMTPINYIDENGEMHTCSNYTVLTGGVGETKLEAGWYVVNSNITYSNGNGRALSLKGDATIILCDSTTMTVTAKTFGIIGDTTLTIYGQSLDPNEAGTLNLNTDGSFASVDVQTYFQHSGNVIAISSGTQAIYASKSVTVNGGSLQTSGKRRGIYAWHGDLTISGGTVTAFSTDTDGEYPGLYTRSNVIINGGKVETNGISATHNISLGYTHADDYILAGNYSDTVTVKSGQSFYYENTEGEQVIVSDTLSADQINAIAGKMLRPYIVPTTVTQTVTLSAGANWFSTHLEITLDDLKAALVAALSGTNIVIKSKTQNAKYNGSSWRGNLTWDLSKMYLITVESACEITLEGEPINPADHPATILSGQSNWIAFPINEEMTLSAAFAGFNAVNGDVVKSKTGNAKYNGSTWRATGLNKLEPGKGYLFNSASSQTRTLTFPSAKKQ